MPYNHRTYVETFAKEHSLAFHAATHWDDLLSYSHILRDTREATLIADFDEASQFVTTDDDSIFTRTTYNVFCFTPAEVGNISTAPEAQHQAREILDEFVRTLLRDAHTGAAGLRHLDRSSVEINTMGMLGDWSFGVSVSYTIINPFCY